MFIWNIENLKKEIKLGLLSQATYFHYLLAFLAINAMTFEIMPYMSSEDRNIWNTVGSFINVLIILFGTAFAFRANGGAQGKLFLEKYLSIGFVMGIRFVIFSIPVVALYWCFYSFELNEYNETLTNLVDTLPSIFIDAAMYWRICIHIKEVNS